MVYRAHAIPPFPIGYKCGGLVVESEKTARTDGRTSNKWGYICRCTYCGCTKWISYAQLHNGSTKSCGCMKRQFLSGGNVDAEEVTEAEREFVRKWTRNKEPEPRIEDYAGAPVRAPR